MNANRVGIHGIGIYLPDNVVKNDAWPADVIQKWSERQTVISNRPPRQPTYTVTEGMKKVIESMAELRSDPFRGSKERRRMPEGTVPSDMEAAAAKEAITKAGVEAKDIDLLLVYSSLPDYLTVSNAGAVHHKVGLPKRCLSIGTDNACASFLTQAGIAEQMIRGGAAKRALLVQSSAVFRKVRTEDEFSPWFGDGASAVVLGPASDDSGFLGHGHFSDGAYHGGLVTSCAGGKRWWEGESGELFLHPEDFPSARKMMIGVTDWAREAVGHALSQANVRPEDIKFYAAHQASPWFAELTRSEIGLTNAKTLETFSWAGNLAGTNIPLSFTIAEKEGLLKKGDLVAMYSIGAGLSYSGVVMRWGN